MFQLHEVIQFGVLLGRQPLFSLALDQVRDSLLRFDRGTELSDHYKIDRTTPPSTRSAAPFVADDSGLATNTTSAATSSGVAKR